MRYLSAFLRGMTNRSVGYNCKKRVETPETQCRFPCELGSEEVLPMRVGTKVRAGYSPQIVPTG